MDALVAMLGAGNVAVQGVNNYPADVNGFFMGGSATGSQNAASVCIGGYSVKKGVCDRG